MFDLCMQTCAGELGFPWTAEDRARLLRAGRAGGRGDTARPAPTGEAASGGG